MTRWILVIAGTALVSWGLLTPDVARSTRAASSVLGGAMMVVGLNPDRMQRRVRP